MSTRSIGPACRPGSPSGSRAPARAPPADGPRSPPGLARGEGADPLFVQHRLFNKPLQRAVQAAARRYPAPLLASAIAHAAAIDRAIKGISSGAPWEEFIVLGLKLAHGSKA